MNFPTVAGSVICATAIDDDRPSTYMLAVFDEPDAVLLWVHPQRPDNPYRPKELTVRRVLYNAASEVN